MLEATLAAHGVETRLVGMTVGPTVTRYELELAPGVKVNRVTSLNKDIAYAMASPDVRILAPIPGRSAIGVEVPNKQRQLVTLGDILSSARGAARRRTRSRSAMGRDIAGRAVMSNLATIPARARSPAQTGAGKSSCINSIVTSILDALDARPGAPHPRRPEAGRARASTTGCRTCSPRSSPTRRRPRTRSTGPCARWRCATTCSPRSACATSPATTRCTTAASCRRRRSRSRDRQATSGCRSSSSSSTSSNDLMMVAARDVED